MNGWFNQEEDIGRVTKLEREREVRGKKIKIWILELPPSSLETPNVRPAPDFWEVGFHDSVSPARPSITQIEPDMREKGGGVTSFFPIADHDRKWG